MPSNPGQRQERSDESHVALKRALESVYSQLKYYPEGHPSRVAALQAAVDQMDAILRKDGELTLSVPDERFLVNGLEVQDPLKMGTSHFVKAMTRARAADITVRSGIAVGELERFFGIIERAVEGSVTVEDGIAGGNLAHMRVEVVRWERVRDGEVVVTDDGSPIEPETTAPSLVDRPASTQLSPADEAIVEILVKEFSQGQVDAGTLARLAIRLFPDPAALKAALPVVKERLMAAGMGQLGYVEFVRELNRDLKHDDLVRSLEMAADASGATVDELMQEIRSNPEHVGKLMILGAELFAQGEEGLLVQGLADTVDSLADRLLADVQDTKSARQSARILRSVEKAVEAELKSRNASDERIAEFAEAVSTVTERIPLRGMVSEVMGAVRGGERDPSKLARKVVRAFGSLEKFRPAERSFTQRLRAEGFGSTDIDALLAEAEDRFGEKALNLARKRLARAVHDDDAEVLNRAAVEWLVNREVEGCRTDEKPLSAFLFEMYLVSGAGRRVCREQALLEWAAGQIGAQAGPRAIVGRYDEIRLIGVVPGVGSADAAALRSAIAAEMRSYRIELGGEETQVECEVRGRCWEPVELAGRDAATVLRELRIAAADPGGRDATEDAG